MSIPPPTLIKKKKYENIFAWFPFLSLLLPQSFHTPFPTRYYNNNIITGFSSKWRLWRFCFVLVPKGRPYHISFKSLISLHRLSMYPLSKRKKSHHSKLQNQMTHSKIKEKRQLTKQNFQNQLNTRNWNESKRNKIER